MSSNNGNIILIGNRRRRNFEEKLYTHSILLIRHSCTPFMSNSGSVSSEPNTLNNLLCRQRVNI